MTFLKSSRTRQDWQDTSIVFVCVLSSCSLGFPVIASSLPTLYNTDFYAQTDLRLCETRYDVRMSNEYLVNAFQRLLDHDSFG